MNLDRMKQLLQQAVPPVKAEPGSDLWPAMQRRLDAEEAVPASPRWAWLQSAWFDAALATGLVILAVCFPASIPMLLYCL
jgi:hypothetical protein